MAQPGPPVRGQTLASHLSRSVLKALQQLAEGSGPAFAAAATPALRRLLFRGLHHPNRFVREAGYHTLAALCACTPAPELSAWGPEAAARLEDGLSENWSQV